MIPPITILLAEDDSDDVLLTQTTLDKAGAPTPAHVVRDGAEAIAYFRGSAPFQDRTKHPLPNLLLLDLRMPAVTGFEVLEWLRQRPELRPVIITVLTGSESPQDVERANGLGADFYIHKPCAFDAMVVRLKRLVKLSALPIGLLAAQERPIQLPKRQ